MYKLSRGGATPAIRYVQAESGTTGLRAGAPGFRPPVGWSVGWSVDVAVTTDHSSGQSRVTCPEQRCTRAGLAFASKLAQLIPRHQCATCSMLQDFLNFWRGVPASSAYADLVPIERGRRKTAWSGPCGPRSGRFWLRALLLAAWYFFYLYMYLLFKKHSRILHALVYNTKI